MTREPEPARKSADEDDFKRKVIAIIEADISGRGKICHAIRQILELELRRHGFNRLK